MASQLFVECFLTTIETRRQNVAVERANGIAHLLHVLGMTGEVALQCGVGLNWPIPRSEKCCEILFSKRDGFVRLDDRLRLPLGNGRAGGRSSPARLQPAVHGASHRQCR